MPQKFRGKFVAGSSSHSDPAMIQEETERCFETAILHRSANAFHKIEQGASAVAKHLHLLADSARCVVAGFRRAISDTSHIIPRTLCRAHAAPSDSRTRYLVRPSAPNTISQRLFQAQLPVEHRSIPGTTKCEATSARFGVATLERFLDSLLL